MRERRDKGDNGPRAAAPQKTGRQSARAIGARYERLAAEFLEGCGYEILERNFRSRAGEIDLIAREGSTLAFVEVKYRAGDGAGDPAEAVDAGKQERIRKTAGYYLYIRGIPENQPCRFDVVAVLGERFRLLRDAF